MLQVPHRQIQYPRSYNTNYKLPGALDGIVLKGLYDAMGHVGKMSRSRTQKLLGCYFHAFHIASQHLEDMTPDERRGNFCLMLQAATGYMYLTELSKNMGTHSSIDEQFAKKLMTQTFRHWRDAMLNDEEKMMFDVEDIRISIDRAMRDAFPSVQEPKTSRPGFLAVVPASGWRAALPAPHYV